MQLPGRSTILSCAADRLLASFLSRNSFLSPEGATENSPGREPGVWRAKALSPEGATQRCCE